MKNAFGVLLFVGMLSWSAAQECYVQNCFTADSDNCTEYLPEGDINLPRETCEQADQPCLKRVTHNLGGGSVTRVQRGCLTSDMDLGLTKLIGCQMENNQVSGGRPFDINYCVCHLNLCNGSGLPSPALSLLAAAALAVSLLLFR